jgi:hypothetical protein
MTGTCKPTTKTIRRYIAASKMRWFVTVAM